MHFPGPGNIQRLSILITSYKRGKFGQYLFLCLREPDWGELILAAQDSIDTGSLLFQAAAKHPAVTLSVSARLKARGETQRYRDLWTYVGIHPAALVERVLETIPIANNLILGAVAGGQTALVESLWRAVEAQPDKLAARAWETSLDIVANFLETAELHKRVVEPLWAAIEDQPEEFVLPFNTDEPTAEQTRIIRELQHLEPGFRKGFVQ